MFQSAESRTVWEIQQHSSSKHKAFPMLQPDGVRQGARSTHSTHVNFLVHPLLVLCFLLALVLCSIATVKLRGRSNNNINMPASLLYFFFVVLLLDGLGLLQSQQKKIVMQPICLYMSGAGAWRLVGTTNITPACITGHFLNTMRS